MQNADATVTESLAQVTNRQIRLIHQHKRLGFRRYIAGYADHSALACS
jgi:hypothetical protein